MDLVQTMEAESRKASHVCADAPSPRASRHTQEDWLTAPSEPGGGTSCGPGTSPSPPASRRQPALLLPPIASPEVRSPELPGGLSCCVTYCFPLGTPLMPPAKRR